MYSVCLKRAVVCSIICEGLLRIFDVVINGLTDDT